MKRFLVPGLLAAAAAGAALLPWYAGHDAERRIRAHVERENADPASPVTLALERYDRGWLSASAVTRVTLRGDPAMTFALESEIRHGPRPGVGWLAARTVPRWDAAGRTIAEYYFASQPAFAVESVARFDGTVEATLTSPASERPLHSLPGAWIRWGGARLAATLSPDGRVRFSGELPRVGLSGMGYSLEMGRLALDGDWRVAGPQVDWTGETRLAIANVSGTAPDATLALSGFSAKATQRGDGATVALGLVLEAAALRAASPGEGGVEATAAALDVELAGLDKPALARYLDAIAAIGRLPQTADRAELAAAAVQRLLLDLSAGTPTLALKRAAFRSSAGDFSAQLTASFDGRGLARSAAPEALSQRLTARGSARFSETLAVLASRERLAAEAAALLVEQGHEANARNVRLVADELGRERLGELVSAGLLEPLDGGYAVEARWERGELSVNGRPASAISAALAPR